VTVTYKLKQYGITVKGDAEKGTVEAPETVEHGSNAVIKVTPVTGYVVDKITVDGEDVDFTAENDVATYTVETVTAAHEITVTYKLKQYVIVIADNELIEKSQVPESVEHGSDAEITIIPKFGYVVSGVKVGDTEMEFSYVEETESYKATITDVTSDTTVTVQIDLGEAISVDGIISLSFAEAALLREIGGKRTQEPTPKHGYTIPGTYVYEYVVKKGTKVTIGPGADASSQDWRYTLSKTYVNEANGKDVTDDTNEPDANGNVEITVETETVIKNIKVHVSNQELKAVTTEIDGKKYYVEYKFVIDEKAPSVEMEPSNVNGAPGYHKDSFEVTITAKDLPEEYYSGIAKVELGYSYLIGDAPVTGTIAVAPNADTEGKWTAAVDLSQFPETDVTLTVTVTDLAGNSTPDSYKFVADRTAPVVDVEFNNNEVKNEKYFSDSITATVTVTDVNFDPANTFALINGNRIDWTEDKNFATDDPAKHRMIVPITEDGNYTFNVIATDKAGNAAAGVNYAEGTAAPEEFTIDTNKPERPKISYSDGIFDTVINGLSFGFFGKDTVEVTLTAGDALSGIDYFIYYAPVENNDNGITYDFIEINKSATHSFDIPAQYRGKVKFIAVDMAGNQVSLEDDKIIVVDNIDPIVSVDLT
ncbi:MAG: Ig-like domain repeat protein, partial [Clostridia bacterium]|nr:Ig-like domain repeat protein [Clostridia bacterium]